MEIFDNLAKAAKGFFVEPGNETLVNKLVTNPARANTGPAFAAPEATGLPVTGQAEQRHLDHVAGLLAGDGKDFPAYLKVVKSLAAAGLNGPMLYQTSFNAFSAVNGATVPGLLTSAGQFEAALAADRDHVLARHREKLGEAVGPGAPGPLVQLAEQERQLAADLATLSQQLQAKQQQLADTQRQLAAERQKTQVALASYELAQSTALAELQAHRKAAEGFLINNSK
ncbi:hypothetical protein QMK33_02560 [Hymenobacter sp. H14-R3]|uniref:hypothetical protein n=1 Tax=Hymenobacter sp. H14-R3 TaxID=3046308 RepID=UPI0024BA0A25|nr:hypothetical protein [Hymenobacter sp. H14-R3]MDJ0364019.1 hypothetical protein [Hymenobacter sp. H14-R3]